MGGAAWLQICDGSSVQISYSRLDCMSWRPLVDGGAVVTAELADLAVDQCVLVEGRFTLLAPDDYRGDTLDIKLFDRRGQQLAHESLYAEDEDADEDE